MGAQVMPQTVAIQTRVRSIPTIKQIAKLPAIGTARTLRQEYIDLLKENIEGFSISLHEDENLFNWNVVVFGPKDTFYRGGYFKARINFPSDYPFSPPTMNFISDFFHPNVSPRTGTVCMPILNHYPSSCKAGHFQLYDGWKPTLSVRVILVSLISLLKEPDMNCSVSEEAFELYRKLRNSNGECKEYEEKIRHCVSSTIMTAKFEGIDLSSTEVVCKDTSLHEETSTKQGNEDQGNEDQGNEDQENEDQENETSICSSNSSRFLYSGEDFLVSDGSETESANETEDYINAED